MIVAPLPLKSLRKLLAPVGTAAKLAASFGVYLESGAPPFPPSCETIRELDQFYLQDENLFSLSNDFAVNGAPYIAHLSDVLVGQNSLVVYDGAIIVEGYGPPWATISIRNASSYYNLAVKEDGVDGHTAVPIALLENPGVKVIDEPHFFVSNEKNDRNIFHFQNFVVPRFGGRHACLAPEVPGFFSYPPSRYQVMFMRELPNISRLTFGDGESTYLFKDLFFPVIGQPYLFCHSNYYIHRNVSRNLQFSKPRQSRIFISRSDADSRKILNENDLLPVLTDYNFQIVTLSYLTPLDQLKLFANADFVVFPHGAGASNTSFSRIGTRLLELSPVRDNGPHFCLLASQFGLHYELETEVLVKVGRNYLADVHAFRSSISHRVENLLIEGRDVKASP